ncbi:MAG TPA: hypothetical protein DCG75_05055 [Bacteroidales bacterium]|nr:hypothetical protein [Bacteroidales bacterium]
MHYQEKLDNIFAEGSLWQHRTLRTIFDPFSSEYDETTIDEKIEILKKIKNNKIELSELIDDYKEFYLEENKPNVINSVEYGLRILLVNALK